MSKEGGGEASRPRPVSAGVWTLLWWLRREERASSLESLSSVGSDRTTASFAFLPPKQYRLNTNPAPIALSRATDSYNKRLKDINIRKQLDEGITLHRKYGLFREPGDTFTLPSSRKTTFSLKAEKERSRRATSEGQQRCSAHVPGKRRAPPPPAGVSSWHHTVPPSFTLPRQRTRKRRAPPPPIQEEDKENYEVVNMNSKKNNDKKNDMDNTNFISKEINSTKELKHEKSFLRNIFDSKKKTSSVCMPKKYLPNISELDQQATEIIQKKRASQIKTNSEENEQSEYEYIPMKIESWFCSKCLRKYNNVLDICMYCKKKRPESILSTRSEDYLESKNKPSTSNASSDGDEKQKLKEMLKEIKDSLPKIHNYEYIDLKASSRETTSLETPTLPIGFSLSNKSKAVPGPSSSKDTDIENQVHEKQLKNKEDELSNTVIITQVVPINDSRIVKNADFELKKVVESKNNLLNAREYPSNSKNNVNNLQTPLKISSLLNPLYVPNKEIIKSGDLPTKQSTENNLIKINELKTESNSKIDNRNKIDDKPVNNIIVNKVASHPGPSKLAINKIENIETQKSSPGAVLPKPEELSKHKSMTYNDMKQKALVKLLQESIANGDEKLAAQAAVELAQLRLPCSVTLPAIPIPEEKGLHQSKVPVSSTNNNKNEDKTNPEPTNNKKCTSGNTVTPVVVTDVKVIKKDSSTNTKQTVQKNSESHVNVKGKSTNNETKINKPSTSQLTDGDFVSIEVWIEDKIAARGPVRVRVPRRATLAELRARTEAALGLPARQQRWIVDNALYGDPLLPLATIAGKDFTAPFYLCLVEDETKDTVKESSTDALQENPPQNQTSAVYSELMKLEERALITNLEKFTCEVCMEECPAGGGAVLKDCVHSFCRECLVENVRHCQEAEVSCPATGCVGMLQEREIRALVSPQEYERWLARGLAAAESGTKNSFHCRTRDCAGWALCEPGSRRFPCPVCKRTNCLVCKAIHEGQTCTEHKAKLQEALKTAETMNTAPVDDEGTRTLIESMISRGEALECPECSAIITKKWGCDWVKCSACKTEICWVTRGRRWGPAGRGDTSAGCRCGVDGKRCHPSCAYCH